MIELLEKQVEFCFVHHLCQKKKKKIFGFTKSMAYITIVVISKNVYSRV